MLPFKTKYFAHRGLHGDHSTAPENSLAAFRRAAEAGYGMEMDVQLSKDGQVVVFHDDTLDRVCGVPGYLEDYTLKELHGFKLHTSEERIPLFSEVLKTVDGRTPLIIELKTPGNVFRKDLCEKVASILDGYTGEYCIESFHPLVLFWFRRNRPHVLCGQLCTDFFRTHARGERWQFFLLELMMTNFLTHPDFISYDIHYRKAPAFRVWRHFITPVAWTVRSREDLEDNKKYFDYFIMERTFSS